MTNPSQADPRKIREERQSSLERLHTLNELVSHHIFSNVVKAQNLLDEMEKLLSQHYQPDLQISYFLHSGLVENLLYNYHLSENQYVKALKLLEELGDIQQQAEAYIDLTGTLVNLDKHQYAQSLLEKTRRMLKAYPNPRLHARILVREGNIHLHFHNDEGATQAFLEAEKLLTLLDEKLNLKDYFFLSLVYAGLGQIYNRNDEGEKSVKAINNAIDICIKNGMHSRLSWLYQWLGNAYLGLHDENNAELYFNKAIESKEDFSQLSRAAAYANLGFLSMQKQKYQEALDLFDKAETLYKEKNSQLYSNFSEINRWRGMLYSDQGKTRKAQRCFDLSYQQASASNDMEKLCAITKEMTQFYAAQGDYKTAYFHQTNYEVFYEKYHEELKKRKIIELEIQYEAEKKKQEAELLRLQATKLQLKALRAQMNPHFMHNALNSIQDYISSGDTTNASLFLAKFADLMRRSLDYSEYEIISLEKELEFLENYLELNKRLRFENSMEYSIEVDEEIEEDIFGVPTMIVQPYVENAIEHGIRRAQKGNIKVIFQLLNDHTLLCIVEDDGVGREEAMRIQSSDPKYQNHRSMGTKITEDRLRILQKNAVGDSKSFVNIIDLKDPNTGKALGTRIEIGIPIFELNAI